MKNCTEVYIFNMDILHMAVSDVIWCFIIHVQKRVLQIPGEQNKQPKSNGVKTKKGAVHRHFDRFLIMGKLPGKKEILACFESENDLHNRSWKNVKDSCRNLIETKKRRGLLT